ncbi:MAG TPA: TonB family protein [Croceibacterium sp.]|nr:TonB family protein [Croceibacterium sp.]
MSYLNQAQDPRRRVTAIAGVTIIHAALGLGLVVGMTVYGFKPVEQEWRRPVVFTPKPEPKPPEPPPTAEPQVYDPIVAPPEPLPIPRPDTMTVELIDETPVIYPDVSAGPTPGPIVEPPRPGPSFVPKGVRPSTSPSSWISTDDYPRRPLTDGVEGTARYSLVVGTGGRVSSCEITRSTGNAQLDEATCRLLTRRARFDAATDESGAKVLGTYSGSVRWDIPD